MVTGCIPALQIIIERNLIDRAIVVFAMLIPGILINKNTIKSSGGFWGQYVQNMRHANYLSSLLLHREYANERKIFNYNQEIEDRFHKDCSRAMKKNSKLGQKRLVSECWTTVFAAVYSMMAIILLALPVNEGIVSIGSFIAAFTAIASLRTIANQLYASVFDVSNNFEKMKGFFSLLDLEEEQITQLEENIDLKKGIEFQNVSFSLKLGTHYALVGENGAGKTTLSNVILGLFAPTSGSVYYDNKNVLETSEVELRKRQSVVPQNFMRYKMSVRDNIAIADFEHVDEEKIEQKYRDFFEDSQVKIDDILGKELGGKTGLIVTHKLGAVMLADRIVVLEHGRIVQEGTHHELLCQDGPYLQLWNIQAKSFV